MGTARLNRKSSSDNDLSNLAWRIDNKWCRKCRHTAIYVAAKRIEYFLIRQHNRIGDLIVFDKIANSWFCIVNGHSDERKSFEAEFILKGHHIRDLFLANRIPWSKKINDIGFPYQAFWTYFVTIEGYYMKLRICFDRSCSNQFTE